MKKRKILSYFKKNNYAIVWKFFLILFLVLAILYWLTGFRNKTDRKKIAEPSFCVANEDCGLYNCTNCGNQLWIIKNKQSNEGCSLQISIGCKCDNNICKRVYQ